MAVSPKLTLKSTVAQANKPLTASIKDELVILDNVNNHYYGLEAVGSRVWNLLETPRPLNELVEIVCEEYEVAPQVFSKDCLEFVETLQAKGLVVVSN